MPLWHSKEVAEWVVSPAAWCCGPGSTLSCVASL